MFVVMSLMIIVTMMVMIKGILIKIIILTAIMVAERKKNTIRKFVLLENLQTLKLPPLYEIKHYMETRISTSSKPNLCL